MLVEYNAIAGSEEETADQRGSHLLKVRVEEEEDLGLRDIQGAGDDQHLAVRRQVSRDSQVVLNRARRPATGADLGRAFGD